MNIIEFIKNTVQRTLSKYDERFSTVAESGSYDDLSNKPTIPEAYDDTALAARVTTLETDKVTVTTASIPGGGGGEEVTVSVQEAQDQTGEKVIGVRYFTDDQGVVSGDPTLIVGNQNFSLGVDGKTLSPTGWGVVRTGVATVEFNNSKWSSSATVDVSDLGFSSGADYDVVAQPTTGGTAAPWGNAIAFVNADKGASSFSVSSVTMEESLSGTVNVKYTIFAKGYGAVAYTGEIPTGGTTGQVLTKRSDADGDYGWQNKIPSYIVDKPEGNNSQLGNVVQVGTLENIDGTELGIYEFYYRTSGLPNTTSNEYTLLPLLQDYDIVDFIDGTGVTSNGIFIGNGRTDGTNYVIIQQFSKNRKAVILRTYQDYSTQTALLKIKFLGTKTTA